MGTPEIICRSLAGQFTTVLFHEVLQHWTNFYFSFTDCRDCPCWLYLTMLEPGGVLNWKWGTVMCRPYARPLRPFFHALFPKTAISEFFFSTFAWNHKFLENLHFKSLKIEEKFSSYAYHLVKSWRGYVCQNCMWMCLLHLEKLTFSIPTFSTITHPSVYHFRKKSTQFCSIGCFLPKFAQNTPNLYNLSSVICDENLPIAIPKFAK